MTSLKLFFRAYGYLLYFHWLVRRDVTGDRFKILYRSVRQSPVHSLTGVTELQVTEKINHAIALLPVKVRCLQRASATVKLLRQQGIHAQMVIGATVYPFDGHAWVEIDGRAINERPDTQAIYGVLDRC